MSLRPAKYEDIEAIGNIYAKAFHDESLNSILYPYRNEYPEDHVRSWRHLVTESWYDYQKTIVVSYDIIKNEEVVTGAAIWRRTGEGWEALWNVKGWWDPRLLILPCVTQYHVMHRFLFRNRAALRPSPSHPTAPTPWTWQAASYPFMVNYLVPPTSESSTQSSQSETTPLIPRQPHSADSSKFDPNIPFWELANLGVSPEHQNLGLGRSLTAWGVEVARQEDLPALVISADKKERFYQRCGFTELVGWATDGEKNPLRIWQVEGGAILWMMRARDKR